MMGVIQMTEQRLLKRVEAKKIALCAAETELEYYQSHRGPGRPVSVGSGKKVSVYLPIKSLELLDRITREWSGSRSDIIQEALARYAADLDGVIQEGESHDITADY